MEIANAYVCGGGSAVSGAVRRLAGCLHAPPDPAPNDDKRPPGNAHVFLSDTSMSSTALHK